MLRVSVSYTNHTLSLSRSASISQCPQPLPLPYIHYRPYARRVTDTHIQYKESMNTTQVRRRTVSWLWWCNPCISSNIIYPTSYFHTYTFYYITHPHSHPPTVLTSPFACYTNHLLFFVQNLILYPSKQETVDNFIFLWQKNKSRALSLRHTK